MNKVSIIVPVYNAEKTLKQTLDSLVAQTILQEIEIVCVDDCSTDRSREVIDKYAATHEQILPIFCTKNGGTLHARSVGVSASHGDYILFVDSDDGLEPDACEKLYDMMRLRRVDVLNFGTTVVAEAGVSKDIIRNVQDLVAVHGRPLCGTHLVHAGFVDHVYSLSLWNKIYRAEIVRRAFAEAPEGRYLVGEDIFITFLVMYYARSFSCVTDAYYRYHIGNGISTATNVTITRMKDYCTTAVMVEQLRLFLMREGVMDFYAQPWQIYHDMLLGDCVNKWKLFMSKEESPEGFELLLRSWGAEAICSYLIKTCGSEQRQLAEKIGRPACLNASPRTIKTIGVFYYRVANGGIERVASTLINMWNQSGYRIVLFTDKEPEEDEYLLPEQIERYVLADSLSSDPKLWQERFSTLHEAVQSCHIDLFVHHAWLSPMLLWDMLAIKSAGIPYLQVTHGVFSCLLPEGSYYFMQDFERLTSLYALQDMTLVLSQTNQAFWRCFSPNTQVIANPCHLSTKDHKPAALRGHDILWAGRIAPEKHLADAIEAMGQVVTAVPDARLVVVGKADDCFAGVLTYVQSRVKDLHLENAVCFEGFKTDLTPYYESASVFVSTSEYEGYPMAVAESKVFGLPCVMYAMPYLSFSESKNEGLIQVDQQDIDGLAKALIHLLKDDAWRSACGEQARRSAEQFSNERIQAQWIEIFRFFETSWNTCIDRTTPETVMLQTLLHHGLKGAGKLQERLEAASYPPATTPLAASPTPMKRRNLIYRILRKLYHALRFMRQHGFRATLAHTRGVISRYLC